MRKRKIVDAFAVFAAAFIVTLAIGFWVTPSLGLWGTVIGEALIVLIAFGVVKLRGENFKERFSFNPASVRSGIGAVVFSVGVSFAASATSVVFEAVFKGTGDPNAGIWKNFISGNSTTAVIITLVAVPAICEELLFRGYLQSAFGREHPAVGITVVAVLFGVMHVDPRKMIPTAILGAAFAYVTYVTDSVLPAIICHLVNNSRAVVDIYSQYGSKEEMYKLVLRTPTLLVSALGTLALGFIIGYIGYKMLTGKRLKKPFGMISVLLVMAVIIGSVFAFIKLEFTYHVDSDVRQVCYEQPIETDADRLCMIYVAAYGDGDMSVTITVTDEEGGEVAHGSGTFSYNDVLPAGKYKLTVMADKKDYKSIVNALVSTGPRVELVNNED